MDSCLSLYRSVIVVIYRSVSTRKFSNVSIVIYWIVIFIRIGYMCLVCWRRFRTIKIHSYYLIGDTIVDIYWCGRYCDCPLIPDVSGLFFVQHSYCKFWIFYTFWWNIYQIFVIVCTTFSVLILMWLFSFVTSICS